VDGEAEKLEVAIREWLYRSAETAVLAHRPGRPSTRDRSRLGLPDTSRPATTFPNSTTRLSRPPPLAPTQRWPVDNRHSGGTLVDFGRARGE
jgi:hypothetical protein